MHTLCPRCRAYTGGQDLILPSWHQGPRWTRVLQIITPLWNFLQLPSFCALFSLVPLPEAFFFFFFSNWYIHLFRQSPSLYQIYLYPCLHGQRSLEGCSPWGHKELDVTEHACTLLLSWKLPKNLVLPVHFCVPCTRYVASQGVHSLTIPWMTELDVGQGC